LFHLLDRGIGNVKAELLLGNGESEPELAPCVKAILCTRVVRGSLSIISVLNATYLSGEKMRHFLASIATVEDWIKVDCVVSRHDTDLERGVWYVSCWDMSRLDPRRTGPSLYGMTTVKSLLEHRLYSPAGRQSSIPVILTVRNTLSTVI
jgi:hypothetical protein